MTQKCLICANEMDGYDGMKYIWCNYCQEHQVNKKWLRENWDEEGEENEEEDNKEEYNEKGGE